MGKFKVGDRVRVLDKDKLKKLSHDYVDSEGNELNPNNVYVLVEMLGVAGEEFTISHIFSGDLDRYRLQGIGYYWDGSMLELVENEPKGSEPDMVNNPAHYQHGGIETLDIIKSMLSEEEFKGYLKGNILKYRERAEHKGNATQDYAKAKFYYDMLHSDDSKGFEPKEVDEFETTSTFETLDLFDAELTYEEAKEYWLKGYTVMSSRENSTPRYTYCRRDFQTEMRDTCGCTIIPPEKYGDWCVVESPVITYDEALHAWGKGYAVRSYVGEPFGLTFTYMKDSMTETVMKDEFGTVVSEGEKGFDWKIVNDIYI